MRSAVRLGAEFEAELDRTVGYITGMPLAGLRAPNAPCELYSVAPQLRRISVGGGSPV